MKIQDLSVRHRLILNNIIMVFVPVLLLVIIGSTVFYGLRATGNFREREIELLWPEAGNSAPILMGLSHIFTNVDGGERESLGRHVGSMEAAGIEVAVVRDGEVVYETVPGQARSLINKSYELASGDGNVLHWDDDGLVYRYVSKDKKSIGVAIGPVPFLIGRGFFPPHMGLVWSLIAIGVFLLAAAVIVFIGFLLVRRMTRDIVAPLEDLQHASRRIASGDYDTPVASCSTDELGETAAVFEEMRRQLQAGRKMRDAYEKNRQELFAGIAHDLATPLTKIQGYTGGILDGIAATPEKQKKYLELVYHTSQSMEQMVHELFLLSKLDLGKVDFQWENASLAPLLQQYVDLQKEALSAQGFSLRFENRLPGESPVVLDRIQFQRVLDNVLSNALKYRDSDNGSLTVRLAAKDGGYLIECEDRGRGVAQEDLGRIFESFYRTDKARADVAKGSGLGLAVTARIIEAMQGRIWARPAVPKGLCICIWLPTKQAFDESMKTEETRKVESV
ncbi:sensor histidine kinase [Mitsuokella multacida]|uniref:sensor histidine kinase n=1 Tax=Mitsuokella multacida TaxID=52226 RepID=UPI0022E6FA34|nr:HAMP domain-containing sensor histidine kinase [Mitsuokella multacida]